MKWVNISCIDGMVFDLIFFCFGVGSSESNMNLDSLTFAFYIEKSPPTPTLKMQVTPVI